MTIYIKHNGEEHSITGWADKLGINKITLQQRFRRGMTNEEALTSVVRRPNDSAPQQTLESAAKRFIRRHEALERQFLISLQLFSKASAKQNAKLLVDADMSTLGQPPAGTFKAPGVVVDFAEKPSDRSLSVAQDLT